MEMLTGLGILLLSSVGHTEYWVLFVNRVYSFRIDHRRLRWLRRLHDIAVPLFPLLLFWKCGFGSEGLLTGGTFSQLPAFWQWGIGLTIPGVLPWLVSLLRWQFRQKHSFYQADSRRLVNALSTAETRSQIDDVKGPRRHPFRILPCNQIYSLEINTKTIRVPTAMPQTLRLAHFSDLHFVGCPGEGYYRWFARQAADLQPDAFMFTGDLIDDPQLIPLATEILGSLTSVAPCFFVLGNHDWRFDHEALRTAVQKAGWIDVASQSVLVTLGGTRTLIAGSELPWLGQAPPPAHGNDCQLKVLLSHSPDQLRFAADAGYDVMLAGHTHGGQIVMPLLGPVYSPSIHGVRFASGLFHERGLHLHVSRGVGCKDPIRWNCPPELTCLQIESERWPSLS